MCDVMDVCVAEVEYSGRVEPFFEQKPRATKGAAEGSISEQRAVSTGVGFYYL